MSPQATEIEHFLLPTGPTLPQIWGEFTTWLDQCQVFLFNPNYFFNAPPQGLLTRYFDSETRF